MIEKIKMETRRYAKRQLTWFRKYKRSNVFGDSTELVTEESQGVSSRNKDIVWLDNTKPIEENIEIIKIAVGV